MRPKPLLEAGMSSDDTDPYQPIACSLWDQWELAILKKQRLRLSFVDDQGVLQQTEGTPVDLITRHKAEYLIVEIAGKRQEIRLDRLK